MKKDIPANDSLLRTHRSYTPEEIFAAGGVTAFGRKRAQNNEELIKKIQNAPPIEPFSDEEWAYHMADLAKDK